MTLDEAEKRLALSERTAYSYEAMGGMLVGSVEDRMKMIFAETQVLYTIEHGFPTLAERAKAVGRRYGQLALAVKSGR